MLSLHANVFAPPPDVVDGPEVTLRGLVLRTLTDPAGGPPRFVASLGVSFETMQQRLAALPRTDCEPDGFFLVTGHAGDVFWRLNGHMHELRGSMYRVELNGECPEATLDQVLGALGWPDTELAFELVREGVTLDERAFRSWAAGRC